MNFQWIAIAALSGLSMAHPGAHEPSSSSVASKRDFLSNTRRSLDLCADHLEKRGVNDRARARRASMMKANEKRAVFSRDTDKIVNTSYHSSLQVSANTADSELFSKNPTCILSPEGEVGPFWVKGELIRDDVRDAQASMPLILHGQFIDINTCEPIKDLWWDVWNCNSTGVYSGVQSSMNGNGDDASNLNKTFLRGIQKTDSDGVAQFKTLFPGHYPDRTIHVHVIAHTNAHRLANNTITGGHISHIGQLFFDQDLITKVEATHP
ncbi:hypothetical protein N7490_001745 [Penicillium lividum]|nr:hypothetical protein N7490_001745 [Penicillium lividum]